MATAVLHAEQKLGEITLKMPKDKGGRPSKTTHSAVGSFTKREQLEEIGVSEIFKERCEKLAEHPEILEMVVKEAIELCINKVVDTKLEAVADYSALCAKSHDAHN